MKTAPYKKGKLLIDRFLIPHQPGIYKFKDNSGRVIYVGKALDLYNRVSSYFSSKHTGNLKTASLVTEIASVETIIVESELEALILEANLIKKYLPQYNIRLTDDKDYLYIKVTKEDYPRIITARKKELHNSLKYFGPFPSAKTVKNTLKSLRRVFPWCQFSVREGTKNRRPCFYYHIGQCMGSCAGLVDKKEYRKVIKGFIFFMEGKKEQLVNELVLEMSLLAQQQKFEEASRVRKTLAGITYLTQSNKVQLYLDNPNFLEDQKNLALAKLRDVLGLEVALQRIECYDISNIQGTDATGSMVVLTDGEIDKSQYRKFKIKISGKPNDFAMMAEVLRRRLKNDWPKPDLILVDGGKGQVNAAKSEIKKLKFQVPVYGLAKRMEWLYSEDGQVIKLSKSNPALKLIQRLRDEAHRFAIAYHRKLHNESIIPFK